MESQAQTQSRAGAGRPRNPSRRAREAAANDNLEEPVPKQSTTRRKRRLADVENDGVNDTAPSRGRRKDEFQTTTLSSNRTSQRATNVIKMNANQDGIPMPKSPVKRARIAGGQRTAMPAPPKAKRRLTQQAAAALISLRNPYTSPSKSSSSAPRSSVSMGTNAEASSSSRVISSASTTPRTLERSGERTAGQKTPYINSKVSTSSSGATSVPQPASARAVQTSDHPATQVSLSYAAQVHRGAATSTSSLTPRPAPPVHLEAHPQGHDTKLSEPLNGDASPPRECKAAYSITQSSRMWDVGQLSTSRVDIRDRERSIPFQPEGADDVYSDDDHTFDDYDSDPRALAYAQAYRPSVRNPDAAGMDELDDADLAEMAMDPDADADMEEEMPAQLDLAADLYEDNVNDQDHEVALASERDASVGPHPEHQQLAPPPRRTTREPVPTQRAAEENERTRRAQRTNTPARKKPRAGDYDAEAKQLIDYASTLYKITLTSDHAWPSKLQDRTWAKLAWEDAAEDLESDLLPDYNAISLITRYSWNLRGELKTAARNAVQGAYGFKSATYNNPHAIARNQSIAKMLLNNRAYKYDDPEHQEGLYEADIIQTIINRVYYKDSQDDGVVHDDAYRPFPFRGVALVLTALDCAINEWKTGQWQNVSFDEDYKAVYESHYHDIKQFEIDSKEDKIMTEICTGYAENGRFNAKVPVYVEAEKVGSLSKDDITRAIMSYRARKQGQGAEGQ